MTTTLDFEALDKKTCQDVTEYSDIDIVIAESEVKVSLKCIYFNRIRETARYTIIENC